MIFFGSAKNKVRLYNRIFMSDKSKKICTFANGFGNETAFFLTNNKFYAKLLSWKPRKLLTLNSRGISIAILRS